MSDFYLTEEYAEDFQEISESIDDYLHSVLTTLIQNYHELCHISTVQQSLVNHYTRNMDYLRKHLIKAEKLNEYYSQWQKTCDTFLPRVRREIHQVLKHCFGIILHGIFPDNIQKYNGIFPDHLRKYRRMSSSELDRNLSYLQEKNV